MTAAERKVREWYPDAKSRGPIYTTGGVQFYEITSTGDNRLGYRSLGKGASRARAWTDAASRLEPQGDDR